MLHDENLRRMTSELASKELEIESMRNNHAHDIENAGVFDLKRQQKLTEMSVLEIGF